MNRVESIVNAVVSTVTGLSTTGSNVERDIVYPPQNLPAVIVMQGDDRKDEPTTMNDVESVLDIRLFVFLKGDTFTTLLNQIRAEVYAALMGSSRLGLGYVDSLEWVEDGAPELAGDAEQPVIRALSLYQISYTHSLRSKES